MDALQLLSRVHGALRTPPPEDTTAQRVLDAAARRLELFGIQRTTMEDVARQAGVSRVTIYRHFATKEALVEAVVLEQVRRFLDDLGHLVDSLPTDAERIVEGVAFTVTTLRRHPLLQRLLQGEPELFLPQLTTGAAPLIAYARGLIVDYARPRLLGIPEEDLAVGAEVGIRLVLSLVLTPEGPVDLDDPERLRELARRYAGPFLLLDAARRKAKPRVKR